MSKWKAMCIGPKQSPCQDCKIRAPHCHGSCSLYADYRKLCEDIRKQRKMRQEVNQAVGDAMKRLPGKREV